MRIFPTSKAAAERIASRRRGWTKQIAIDEALRVMDEADQENEELAHRTLPPARRTDAREPAA